MAAREVVKVSVFEKDITIPLATAKVGYVSGHSFVGYALEITPPLSDERIEIAEASCSGSVLPNFQTGLLSTTVLLGHHAVERMGEYDDLESIGQTFLETVYEDRLR